MFQIFAGLILECSFDVIVDFLQALLNILLIWAIFLSCFQTEVIYSHWKHCTHTQLASFWHAVITQTNTCTLSSKWHYVSITPAYVKSKAGACLLTPGTLAELLLSSSFPDLQPSCENINKHCFYYCHSGKFQDTHGSPLLTIPSILILQTAVPGVTEQRHGQSCLSLRMLK